jgi:hypothetical protein
MNPTFPTSAPGRCQSSCGRTTASR